jgi:hypothetical protein
VRRSPIRVPRKTFVGPDDPAELGDEAVFHGDLVHGIVDESVVSQLNAMTYRVVNSGTEC